MTKKALIIVDVQNDFCPGGALPVTNGDQVVAPLNQLIDFAEKNGWLVVASRDWHPEVTNHFKKYGGIWPVHCVQNTPGAEFHPDLKVAKAVIVSKATQPNEDGYSAFDGFGVGQSLEDILKKYGVTKVYVGGLATDYCVKATVLDAVKKGFSVKLLADASRAVNLLWPDAGEKAIAEMASAGAEVVNISEVIGND